MFLEEGGNNFNYSEFHSIYFVDCLKISIENSRIFGI